MADITKKAAASLGEDHDSMLRCVQLGQGKIVAGEALSKFDAIYLKSDGKFWKAVSTEVYDDNPSAAVPTNVAHFAGLAYTDYAAGDPVTCMGAGFICDYETDLTPGTQLFVSNTAGKLADAEVASGDDYVAIAIDARRILVVAMPR